jgi:hypothetical protein
MLTLGQPCWAQPLPAYTNPTPVASKSEGSQTNGINSPPKTVALEVRHLGQGADGWYLTETRNFRVWHNQSRSLAEKFARAAEETRTISLSKWLTADHKEWQPRCDLYLHATGSDFGRATGLPGTVPGVSTTRCENGRVLFRRVDLRCDAENCLDAVLPHEVTHTALAECFTEKRLSPWANEGIAVLAEPNRMVRLHLRNLARYAEQDQLYSARQFIQLKDYPEPRWMGLFYAQSVSLVEFLANAKDPQTVIHFLHDGSREGYEVALQRHFGWDFNELDRRWRQYALSG